MRENHYVFNLYGSDYMERYEGMLLGTLEAMSCGVPCLVTEGTALGNYFLFFTQAGYAKQKWLM